MGRNSYLVVKTQLKALDWEAIDLVGEATTVIIQKEMMNLSNCSLNGYGMAP